MPLVYLARNSLKLIIVCARKALSVGKHRYLLVYLLYLAAAFYIRFAAVTSRDNRAFSDLGAVRMLVINNACAAVMDHRLIAQEHALAPYGEYDDTVITTVEGMGLTVIQWDVDSLDWKKPDPEAITKKVVNSVKSGSIVLFHNDLENTTEALPQILEQLSQKGYEFVPVSELIYTENYTIDPNGMQIPIVQSNTEITPENVDEVMAQYSEQLHSAGVSDEQMALAAQAVKSGAEIPDEVYEALADYAMSNGITPASLISDTAEAPDTMDSESSGAETESGIVK